jgi:TrmH family RNA methyltransferase
MNIIQPDNLCEFLTESNYTGIKTLASVPKSTAVDIRTVPMDGGVICCVGNEGSGLSKEVIEKCSVQVTIPMSGRAESFNASAAAAILAWELKR